MPTLEALLQLPPLVLPTGVSAPLVHETLERLNAPDADARGLATELGRDAELAERLVAAIAQRTGRRVPDLLQGLRLCGLATLEALLTDMAQEHADLPAPLSDLLGSELLVHSQQVATCCYLVSLELGYRQPSEAYLTGLLHDVGLALLRAFPVAEITEALGLPDPMALATAEDALLGGNHAMIGARLLERWQMPLGIVSAVSAHHAPQSAQTGQRLARIVHLAEVSIGCLPAGVPDGAAVEPLDDMVLAHLRLTPDGLRRLAERAVEHQRQVRLRGVSLADR